MKLGAAIGILVNDLLLFGLITATIWLPANLLIEYIVYQHMDDAEAVMGQMRLYNLANGILSPITIGASVYATSRILQGQPVGVGEALGVGFRRWVSLFGARLVAGILIMLGFIALIVPGIYLTIRWALLDSVVILEEEGVNASRARSNKLVTGRAWQILGTGLAFFAGYLLFATLISLPIQLVEGLDNFVVAALLSTVLDLSYVVLAIALVLYYFDARQDELSRQGGDVVEAEARWAEPARWNDVVPDDDNPYRPPQT
jgi:hypothetical protein